MYGVWTPNNRPGEPDGTNFFMNALSRREEDTLLKTTKAYALKQCDSLLQGALELYFP